MKNLSVVPPKKAKAAHLHLRWPFGPRRSLMPSKVASVFATVTALAMSAAGQEVQSTKASFQSGGRTIGVEMFQPLNAMNAPAILVLHGAGGMDYGNEYVRQLATAFAANGYATLLVHYFDRTGTNYAADPIIRANFEKWLETIGDAVSFALQQPHIDPKRMALFGYSLGAYIAVAHASRDNRVRALVELAGGVDPEFAKTVHHLPPTLVLHGEDDRRVPLDRAKEFIQLLRKLSTPFATKFYPGEGHILSPLAAFDALSRGLTFLREQLH